jgi:hypothetical protein
LVDCDTGFAYKNLQEPFVEGKAVCMTGNK